MLVTKILGDLPAITAAHPVTYSGHNRQSWDAHIVVGVLDVTPGNAFGYHWEAQVTAYRAWHPGRHGAPCPCCGPMDDLFQWGAVKTVRLPVNTSGLGDRIGLSALAGAISACDAALAALPSNPLRWSAYGPKHEYGRWPDEAGAAEWLAAHMERLAQDSNLADAGRRSALENAAALRGGAREVAVGGKVYGVRAAC